MRIAYVTAESCGRGHAVRGAALVSAGQRAGLDVRAFGPPDWNEATLAYQPDLLLGDVAWWRLEPLREALGVPAWLLVRWVHPSLLRHPQLDGWDRRMAIEPAAESLPGITHVVPPIVWTEAPFRPTDGQELRAGYSTWWESVAFGYHEHVRWYTDGSPERQARIGAGGTFTTNGADQLMAMIR